MRAVPSYRRLPALIAVMLFLAGCGGAPVQSELAQSPMSRAEPPATPPDTQESPVNRLTFDNLMRIHKGETYHNVCSVLGKPNKVETQSVGQNGSDWVVFAHWEAEGPRRRVTLCFWTGQVHDMDVTGIEPPK